MNIQITPIKTKKFIPPQDDIYEELDKLQLEEKDVVIITSKIVAIHQGACFKTSEKDRTELIKEEAEYTIEKDGKVFPMTVKYNMYTPFSGVDESNSNGYYTLIPQKPNEMAKEFHNYLKKKNNLKELAVLIIDGNLLPLRLGQIGMTVGFFGLKPIRHYEGTKDLFSKILKMSRTNIIDNLACMATIFMGEGDEQLPIVIARGIGDQIEFEENAKWESLIIDPKMDFYSPMFHLYKKK